MNAVTRWLNRSLGRRIAVLVSLLLLLVGGAIFAVSYYQVLQLTRRVASERLHVVSRELADMLGRGQAQTATAMTRIAADPALAAALADRRGPDTAGAAALLRRSLPANGRSVYALIDPRGGAVLAVGPAGQPGWFGPPAEPAREGPSIGPMVKLQDSILYVDTQVPIHRQGRFVGSLAQRARLALSSNGGSALSTIVGAGTRIFLGSRATGAWTDLTRVVAPPPTEALAADSVRSVAWHEEPHLSRAVPVPGVPWDLVLLVPQRIVEAPARAYLGRAIMVAALAIAIGTLGAAGLGGRLARPIREMTLTIGTGEGDRRADENAPGEIGRLARAFNAMLEEVTVSTRRLEESQENLRAFVSHTSQGIWHLEFSPALDTTLPPARQVDAWYQQAPVAECNHALARMHGFEMEGEIGTIGLDRLFPATAPRNRELLLAFIGQGYRCSEAESPGEPDGGLSRVFLNDMIGLVEGGRLRRIWGTRRDVTVERLLDERLAQSQRLEAIGRLAGGVAHDFNNLLTVVLAHSELLIERLAGESEERAGAEQIRETALRAAQLTRQLLLFSRGQVARPGVFDLNEAVSSIESMLRRVIGEDVELKLLLAPDLPHIRADQGQVEQVIMNLVVNARDAMPHGGILTLRTGEIELDEEYVRLHPSAEPGRYVLLAVSDTGVGMPPDVQQHAFDPFFTTKPKGSGTGLGLATVYGVVRQGGGEVSIYSEVGRGTTVRVCFPSRAPAHPAERGTGSRPAPEKGTGTESVLVIEDETAVRDMARRALTSAGYRVVTAGDGIEALRLAEEQGFEFDLLLTDMILPGMSGRDLVVEFRRRSPDIPVIIMSGYTGETYPALEDLPSGVAYLEKPFSLADLRRRVREVLDAGGA